MIQLEQVHFIAPSVAGGGGGGKGASAADAIIPVLNVKDVFGLTYGVKITKSYNT